MRLIDAKKLMDELIEQSEIYDRRADKYEGETSSFYNGKSEAFEAAAHHVCYVCPTVDAVPVVHGHWTESKGEWGDDIPFSVCSVCGKSCFPEGWMNAINNFCPNCGAKMDGGTEDAED